MQRLRNLLKFDPRPTGCKKFRRMRMRAPLHRTNGDFTVRAAVAVLEGAGNIEFRQNHRTLNRLLIGWGLG